MNIEGAGNGHFLSTNHVCKKVSMYDMLIYTGEIYRLLLAPSDKTLLEWLHFKIYFGSLNTTDCDLSIADGKSL